MNTTVVKIKDNFITTRTSHVIFCGHNLSSSFSLTLEISSTFHPTCIYQYFFLEGFLFIYFLNLILFLNFTILYWFCHISKWIHHRYACVPHPEPSSLLPPHTIPLGRPSVPAPSIQYHALNLDWRFISYMTLYIFWCHFPKSSHPLPLPRVQKTVLYISVSFAAS